MSINELASQRSRKYAKEAYLPRPNEVTYDLSLLSQRLLFVREQLLRCTRLDLSLQMGVPETTLREYENGAFCPRYQVFVQPRENAYKPYLLYLLTGKTGLFIENAPIALPEITCFSARLRHLRNKVFQLSREKFSRMLDDFSPYNIKNYELNWRKPAIDFVLLCVTHEKMKPYFNWLFFGENKPLKDKKINLPTVVNTNERTAFQNRLLLLKASA